MITSPNMSLNIPTVGVDVGPIFAYQINTSLNLIDFHDHSPGKGVQITPSGLNINNNLTLNNYSLTNIGSLVFFDNSVSTLDALYVSNGELWFNDTTNPVQITSNGTVNATSSGISSGAASATFAGGILKVYSNTSNQTPGNIQGGSLLLGNAVASSVFLTLQPPTLSGAYTLTLPTIPGTSSILSLSNAGVMSAAAIDTTLAFSGGTLSVAAGGITNTQVSNTAAIASSKLANAGAANAVSGSPYSNNTSTFTTVISSSLFTAPANRPIAAQFSGSDLQIQSGTFTVRLRDTTSNTTIYSWVLSTSNAYRLPISIFNSVFTSTSDLSTHVLALQVACSSGSIAVSTGAQINLMSW